jgi:hypothetical protein
LDKPQYALRPLQLRTKAATLSTTAIQRILHFFTFSHAQFPPGTLSPLLKSVPKVRFIIKMKIYGLFLRQSVRKLCAAMGLCIKAVHYGVL